MVSRLELKHHKIAIPLLCVALFALGVLAGSRLRVAAGVEALNVLQFGLVFLAIALLIMLFVQLIHLREDLAVARSSKGGRAR